MFYAAVVRDYERLIGALTRKALDRAVTPAEREALLAKVAALRAEHPTPHVPPRPRLQPQRVTLLFSTNASTGTTTSGASFVFGEYVSWSVRPGTPDGR